MSLFIFVILIIVIILICYIIYQNNNMYNINNYINNVTNGTRNHIQENFTNIKEVGIYAINMKFRSDKRKRMSDELEKHNLDGEFIDAIVGYNINIEKMTNNNLIDNKINRPLRRGEIGCYLSHIKAWESFLNSNNKYALILEDDAVFIEDFKEKLKNLLIEIDFPFDIIYLNENCENHFGEKCLYGYQRSENLFSPGTVGYGLYGYLLSRRGATKLLNEALPIERPIDDKIMIMYEEGELVGYKLINPYIFVASITDSDTMNIK